MVPLCGKIHNVLLNVTLFFLKKVAADTFLMHPLSLKCG